MTRGRAVDLTAVAQLVVETFAAAPCAAIGAARREPKLSRRATKAPGESDAEAWRFGWGQAGKLWTTAPAGATQGDGSAPPLEREAIFDLASLSKPLTALILARLEHRGLLARSQLLVELLPSVAGTASARVPLDLLASHRAGLQAHQEFFVKRAGAEQLRRHDILRRAADARRPECVGALAPEGAAPVYSDLGYILLGAALEAVSGQPIDALVAQEVAAPLGIPSASDSAGDREAGVVGSSSRGQGLTLGSARNLMARGLGFAQRVVPTEDVLWRGGVLRGVVHDENAWVLAADGSAGHAGIFGDVRSVVRLGTALLDVMAGRYDQWLRPDELAPLLRQRPGGSHAAGFDLRSGQRPSSGRHFGPTTFGHLGFTGTSLWIDPAQELVGVLLSNRVHPTRDHRAIAQARPAAYDALAKQMA